MLLRSIRGILIIGLGALLIACGGEENITDFTEVSDLRLASLDVVSGGTLTLDGDEVDDFDGNILGVYRIDLDDAENTALIDIRATLRDDNIDQARIQFVEIGKAANDQDKVTSVNSGDVVTLDVSEGNNIAYIRVSSLSSAARFEYALEFNRVSSSSALQDILVAGIRATNDNSSSINYTQTFAPDVLTYDVAVGSTLCGVLLVPEPESRFADVRIDGDLSAWRAGKFFHLEPEVTVPVEIEVTPENGGTPMVYTVNLTRNAESDSQTAAATALSSLAITPGRASSDFRCSSSTFEQRIGVDDASSISLTAEIYDSRDGAEMVFGRLDEDELPSVEFVDGTAVTLTSGEAYSGSLFDSGSLVTGENQFLLEVTAANGSNRFQYRIDIVIGETNEVYVSSVTELQAALLAAEPNDEIVIAEGEYVGSVGLGTSGSDTAHFFSAIDGTEANPIILRSENETVSLLGDDMSQNDVLNLQGDYWVVENIQFSGAQNGVVLDGVNQVLLKNIEVSDVGERGIVFQNGTRNSQVDGGRIDDTGESPVTRDGISEIYGEGIVIGAGTGVSSANAVRHVAFGHDIANEHIDVKDAADNTIIQFNLFESDNALIRPVTDRSLVSIGDSDADLSYNQFEYTQVASGTDVVDQLVVIDTSSENSVSALQNIVDLDEQSIVAIDNRGEGDVLLAENRRTDVGDVIVQGASAATDLPVYKIQSTLDSTMCFGVQDVLNDIDGRNETIEDLIVLVSCDDAAAMDVLIEHVEEGFVQLVQNTAERNMKLNRQVYANVVSGATLAMLNLREDLEESDENAHLNASYTLQWALRYRGEDIFIESRLLAGSGFVEVIDVDELNFEVDLTPVPILVQPDLSVYENHFRLIPQ